MNEFLMNMSKATKAVLATSLIGLPEFPVALNALIAAIGVGTMPPPDDLQKALVQIILAVSGGFLVYQMPNKTE